ncbi:MAG: PAS domain S-box protein [Pseudomonadota bacterium]
MKFKTWFLFLGSFWLVCLYLFYTAFIQAQANSIGELNARQRLHARQAAMGIELTFNHWIQELKYLARNDFLIDLNDQGVKFMNLYYDAHEEEIKGMVRVGPDGGVSAIAPNDEGMIGKNISSYPHFQKAKRTGEPAVSEVITSPRGFSTVTIHVPVMKNGRFDGVLAVALDFQKIAEKHLREIKIGETGYAWMISREGVELYCPVPGHIGRTVQENCRDFPSILKMADEMIAGKRGETTYTFNFIRGEEQQAVTKHAVFMPAKIGDTFWSIVVAASEKELLENLTDFRNKLILILVVVMSGGLLIAYFGAKSWGILREEKKRRLAEETLRESEARFRGAFECSSVGKSLTAPDGRLQRVNRAFAAMLGYSVDEMHELDFAALTHPDDLAESWECIRALLSGERDAYRFEKRYIHKNKEIVWADVSSTLLRNEQGAPLQFITHIIDITRRKKVEAELRDSEKCYRTVAEHTYDWEYWQAPDGSLPYMSPSCERLTGRSAEDFKHDPGLLTTVVHPEDRDQFARHLRECGPKANGEANGGVDFRIIAANGEERWIAHACRPVFDQDGSYLGRRVSNRDFTERKRAEDALRKNENLLRKVFEILPVGLWITDKEGALLSGNPMGVKIWGAEPRVSQNEYGVFKARRLPSREEVTPENWALARTVNEKITVANELLEIDAFDGQKKIILNFTSPVLDECGGVQGAIVVNQDITAQMRTMVALRESEERFRGIFETSPIGIAIVDMTDQRFLQANESFLALVGYSADELYRLTVENITPPDDWRHEARLIKSFFEDRAGTFDLEKRYIRKNGEIRFVRVRGDALRLHPGQPPLAVANVIDVTEQLQAAEEKARLQTQLHQAQKMEAVGTLASGVAHDFNNLLQAINGYAQLLLMDKAEADPEYKSLKAIHKAGTRASDLVRRLLLFGRKTDSTRRPLDLRGEVEQARKMLERTIPKMVDIQVMSAWRPWSIMADPVEIEQLLLNLGTNAADAMPEGGKLLMGIENTILGEKYAGRHLGAQPGRYVLLTVSDTGRGMDKEILEKAFDPFFTTKEIGKGTGLGLASVYGIVKRHGGYIKCHSEVGQGTMFKIYFPALEQVETDDAADLVVKPLRGGSETILLVDDEEAVRGVAREALEKYGYQVLTASNGEKALEIFSSAPKEIDLVVMDLGMPGMGGHRCIQELLRIDHAVRVLLASGYSLEGQVMKSLEAGAAGYVCKPYNLSELLNRVRELLEDKRLPGFMV